MKREQKERLIIWFFLGIGTAALVVLGIWIVNHSRRIPDIIRFRSDHVKEEVISADKSDPTLKKPVPDPDTTMLCRMEYLGLHNSAEKTGADGMLTMDDVPVGKDECRFQVYKMTKPQKPGTIKISHDLGDGKYGIALEFDSSETEWMRSWTEAALLFFNHEIDSKTALDAIETVMDTGSIESELFTLKSHNSIILDGSNVTPAIVMEIGNIPVSDR